MRVSEPGPAGTVLRRWRSRPGSRVRTQRQHAGHLGFQASQLSRIETGRRPITHTEARRLLEPLTRDEDDLRRAKAAYLFASGWLELEEFRQLWLAAHGEPICACRGSATFLESLRPCGFCGEVPVCAGDGSVHRCACDPEAVKW